MLGAIGRYLRALGYLVTGRVDSARRELNRNPHVIRATYDRIIEEKKARINQYKDAVARMITAEETKLETIRRLSTEVQDLERLKEGALAKAKSVVQKLQAQGLSMDQIKSNEDYMKCLSAYNDFSSSAKEKNDRIAELEGDVKSMQAQTRDHKVQLQGLLRDLDKIKGEADQTVAEVITAKEEEELANLVSGISEDRTNKELSEMREMRGNARNRARVAREMAGTDTKAQEAEFMEYARASQSTDEFDKLIGLASSTDKSPTTDRRETEAKLPE
jgi:predicted  nucleic acid-binding Zn-ribbon protein